MAPPTILLFGTCDTKLAPLLELRDHLLTHPVSVLLLDCGLSPVSHPLIDIPRSNLLPTTTTPPPSRAALIATLTPLLTSHLLNLHSTHRIHAAISLGGSTGTALAAPALRALPLHFPKLIVTTVAATPASYIGDSDLILVPSLTDIAGSNHLLTATLRAAAAAAAGMASLPPPPPRPERRTIAVSMFGITTAAVTAAQGFLEEKGFEVLILHATGAGGRVLERLVRERRVVGVLDVTTTEVADYVCGGVLSAGADRLRAAAEMGVPQVVSTGATDCINFGGVETVPERMKGRRWVVHNEAVTLVRTTREECAGIGRFMAGNLRRGGGRRTEVWCPARGVSEISGEGGVFCDFEADEALVAALEEGVRGTGVVVRRFEEGMEGALARRMAERLVEMIEEAATGDKGEM